MYTEDDFYARQDRVSDEYIRQLLEDGEENNRVPCNDNDRQGDRTSGGCGRGRVGGSWGLEGGYPLAMVYSPVQEWQNLYDNEMGLSHGTIFKDLDLPFMGKWQDSSCRIGCGGNKNG